MLAKRAERLDRKMTAAPRGSIGFIAIFEMVLGFLKLCPKPVDPVPVNPTPTPTPAQSAAWNDAHHLKSTAKKERQSDGSYAGPGFNKTVRGILKQSRRDGERMRRPEAVEAATKSFADADNDKIENVYSDIIELRHVG